MQLSISIYFTGNVTAKTPAGEFNGFSQIGGVVRHQGDRSKISPGKLRYKIWNDGTPLPASAVVEVNGGQTM